MDANTSHTTETTKPRPSFERTDIEIGQLKTIVRCRNASRSSNNAGAKRRRRLLAEFLLRKPDRQLANVQEQIEFQNHVTLDHDLLFKILILLPAECLVRLQLVCKNWYNLINNSVFITRHTQQSDTLLISLNLTLLEPRTNLPSTSQNIKSYFHFIDLGNGDDSFMESSLIDMVDIRASCNGLILATMLKGKNLILTNPVTRKHITLPLGTCGYFIEESYGIALCNKAKAYKVVHLFRATLGQVGCEILTVSATTRWRKIEVRSSELVLRIMKFPLSINGSLYWMPSKHNCDCFVYMDMDGEKFKTRKLPATCGAKDRILEIGGHLGFVTHAEVDVLHVWILSGENWIKRCSVRLSVDLRCPIPICGSRIGTGIVFEGLGYRLCVYDFDKDEMKSICAKGDIEAWYERIEKAYIPHRNTLASWEVEMP